MRTYIVLAALLAMFTLPQIHAQERTASGSLQNQASWTALQNLINRNKSDIQILQTDVSVLKSSVDALKTDVATNKTNIEAIIACANQGKFYSSTSQSCMQPSGGNRWVVERYDSIRPGITNSTPPSTRGIPPCPSLRLPLRLQISSIEGRLCDTANSRCYEQGRVEYRCERRNEHICSYDTYTTFICN